MSTYSLKNPGTNASVSNPTPIKTKDSVRAYINDLYALTKPTIAYLVVITAIPTMFMTPTGLPPVDIVLATLIGTFLAAGSAGCFNQVADSHLDAKMDRTQGRPLPTGRIGKKGAILFGTILGLVSLAILYIWTTPLACMLAIGANAFYVLYYTMYLKTRTTQNIVIGGAAGAVGPLIGYAAMTGTLSWSSWMLFLIIFLWTPSHFWALAIKYKDDYSKANIPMLPSVKGVETTRRQILLYSLTLLPCVYAVFYLGDAGYVYLGAGLFSTLYFVYLCWKLFKTHTGEMKVFIYSCFYILFLFGVLTIDRLLAILSLT